MPPVFDVLVIGGGPAGISAAVRARWVKRYHVVPCKVALVDPGTLGGLTQMGTCIMTGPSWAYTHETIRPLLLADVERLAIPQVRERVSNVRKTEEGFAVSLANGEVLTTRAVILSCGMKMLCREPEFWGRGVTATSMGIEWVTDKIQEWVSDASRRRIVFAGSSKLTNMMGLVDRHKAPSVDVVFVVEPIAGSSTVAINRSDTIVGTIVEMHGEAALKRLAVERPDGTRVWIEDVDLLVVDFSSYEISPARSVVCDGVRVDENGFVVVDRRQRTSVEGLFAAGDVTGMPSCAGTAIGEGITAGFEAYRYIYRQKFGAEPPLFAYYGQDAEMREGFHELPPLPENEFAVELLMSVEETLRASLSKLPVPEQGAMERTIRAIPSATSLSELAARTEQGTEDVHGIVEKLLAYKLVTIQPASKRPAWTP